MSAEEPVQVWVVSPNGQFVQQDTDPCCGCDECQDDEGPEIEMIFEEDPESICPACGNPIERGQMTIPVTQWGAVYENQADAYPVVGTSRPVHIECLMATFRSGDDPEH